MAIDINDKETIDAFTTFEQIERETYIGNALVSGGHYQAVKPNQYFKVTGNRYAGSTTPDVVRDLWSTPDEVVDWMIKRYGKYDLDAAASPENAKAEKYFTEDLNCLNRWWGSNRHIWLNPPYSHPTPFIKKAIEQMDHNNQIDILLPADNSTAWFYEAQQNAAEIIWIIGEVYEENGVEYSRTGRLAFVSGLTGEQVQGNNKGSVIFVMRKLKDGEQQKTHYVKISGMCPSVKNRRPKKRS